MKFYLHSIGCRLNQSEMETLGRQLLAAGHEVVTDSAESEVAVLNTCAVTAEASRDSLQHTRRIHHQNSATRIVVTGCDATLHPTPLLRQPGVTHVAANRDKDQLIHILDPQVSVQTALFEREPLARDVSVGGLSHTRAFVKVQDGCRNRCTFCITTLARGDSVSRRSADIVAEIQQLAAVGYREAVLTGVHLGSYGQDFDRPVTLYDLVQAILTHTDMPRLRLSSLEPWDISPDFFCLWQNSRLLPHLHLPLQSGCDNTLRRMARRTTRVGFRALVEAARAAIPDLSLTTDIICGFPGETETDFQMSLEYVASLAFSRLHVFTYSPRPGTVAATLPNQTPAAAKKERTQRMLALGQTLSLAFHRRFEGRVLPVLWESPVGADDRGVRWAGYTDNYIRVQAYGRLDWRHQTTTMRLCRPHWTGMDGEPVGENQT